MPCNVCKSNVSPAKKITCSFCGKFFHKSCLSVFNKNKDDPLNWICEECEQNIIIKKNITSRKNRQVNDKILEAHDEDNITSTDINELKSSISIILDKLDILTSSYSSIEKSVSFLSDKVDEYNTKLQSIVQKVKDFDIRLIGYENKISILEREIDLLKGNNNITEQAKLANNLDITGIPKTTNENLKLVVSTLAKIVNVEVKEEHINKTYRLRHKNQDNSRIIVEFTNKEIKNNLLTAIKSRVKTKMPLIAKEIHKNFPENHIYVNEQLSVVNRKIYWLAKQIAKKYNYEYVWANGSGVFLKKAEGMYGVRICNLSQLMSIDTEKSIDQLWIRN